MNAELANEKRFYERFNALHSDPDLVRVFNRFGIDVFRRSSVLEGFAAFLGANGIRGRRCVEIGTCAGLTAIILARHFDEVVTIDIAPHPQRAAIAAFIGVENVRYVEVTSNAQKAACIGGLDFDAAYMDGDHAHDTESDFALVKRCGRVIFHEYWEAQPPVLNLVNALRSRGKIVIDDKLALWEAA